MNSLKKKYAREKALAENDAAIVRYVEPPNLTRQQNADISSVNSCKLADIYSESTLNDVFIKGFDASIRDSLHNYWATNSQVELMDIAFQAKLLLSIPKEFEENSNKKLPGSQPCRSIYT